LNTIERREIAPGVYFSTVKDNRFKTMKITAVAMVPLTTENVAAFALLSQVMTRSCKEYPDFTELSKKLSSLYGASLTGSVQKIGEMQALSFSVSGIDDRYALTSESISEELSQLLCKVMFEPLVENGAFLEDEVEQERRQLIDMADSELGDKRVYANNKLLEVMCKGEAFALRKYGNKELINEVTPKALFDAWKKLLSTAVFEIFYVGESSSQTAEKVFTEKFSAIERDACSVFTTLVDRAEAAVEHTETMEVSQAKLLMGYRTDCSSLDDDIIPMRLMCTILGGSAHSKFFTNVREKQSLCYYCVSRLHRVKGIMVVESGVEFENIEKARKAMEAELEAIRNGDVSDDEIKFAKLAAINSFVSICDSVGGNTEWYVSQLGDKKLMSVEEAVAAFDAVTKEQIVEAANKLTLDTVYILRGE